jgi:hypothetical protein
VVQQTFGQAGLTGVDMGDDPEVEVRQKLSRPLCGGSGHGA